MSSLKFGTSGLRGLVTDLVGPPSFRWTLAFLRHLGRPEALFVGRDLRSSSPAIAADCIAAARAAGVAAVDCGALPTPALALAAMAAQAPAVMVTGSHIPDDRNGLKFYRPDGEIGKDDEAGILARFAEVERAERVAGDAARTFDALDGYRRRYAGFFGAGALAGLTVGVYQHSSVARDVLVELVEALGATAVPLARSDRFVPVDTEAHRPEDVRQLAGWGAEGRFDALVSTDGDADRPLVADAAGRILRGDVLGLLTARHLGIQTIVTPVTSSAAVETSGVATSVVRTRVGSPFVIAGMEAAAASGAGDGIAGFEANGGFLLGSPVQRDGRRLEALPTRDAMLPIIAVLAECRARGAALAALVAGLDAGHALAHRLQEVPAERSGPFLARLAGDADWRAAFFAPVGTVGASDALDGVRTVLANGATVHFRASGNAPELRCYVEAESEEKARELLEWGLAAAEGQVR